MSEGASVQLWRALGNTYVTDTGLACGASCNWEHPMPTPFLASHAARIAADHLPRCPDLSIGPRPGQPDRRPDAPPLSEQIAARARAAALSAATLPEDNG